jgi:hypothetical protein
MTDISTYSTADVDRLLSLADQFLEDWAEDAVHSGTRDVEYEERSAEWAIVRPLLLAAPELLKGLKDIIALCENSPDPMARCCYSMARTSLSSLTKKEIACTKD